MFGDLRRGIEKGGGHCSRFILVANEDDKGKNSFQVFKPIRKSDGSHVSHQPAESEQAIY
jgi:hypothetical protein